MIKLLSGVYRIRNLINGKIYIGSSSQSRGIPNRWSTHVSRLNRGVHGNIHLQSSWQKYSQKAFVFEVIEYCNPSDCIKREQHYLDTVLFANQDDDRFSKLGYNMCRIASSTKGVRLSCETKKRMSKAKAGVGTHLSKLTEEQVCKIKQEILLGLDNRALALSFGVTHSNISKIRTGKTWSHINV